jgi:urease subunit gamma
MCRRRSPISPTTLSDYIVEGAREDKSVAQLMSEGAALLTEEDVLSGVVDLIPLIQVEAHFADGTKLVSIHNPIRAVERQSS